MPSESKTILECDPTYLAKILWEQLKPELWPIPIDQLPSESALIGGSIRNVLLGKLEEKPDLDLVVPNQAIDLTKSFAKNLGGRVVVLDTDRDIARLVINGWTIDFAKQEGKSLQEDLFRRDFRINAIALTLEKIPQLIDPTGGLHDIRQKRLIAINEQNLIDDPLRFLRAFRLMAELTISIDDQTKDWIKCHRSLLTKTAPERIQSEIKRLVTATSADQVIPLVKKSRLLEPWQSESKSYKNDPPSLQNAIPLNNEEKKIALPLARLTHLLSERGLNDLRFSKKQQQRCKVLKYWQERNDGKAFRSLAEQDRFQLHKDLEKDLPALILQLPTTSQVNWIKRWRDSNDPLFHPSPPINGNTLQKHLNLPSGRRLGLLIDHLSHEKAFGRVNNLEEALRESRNWWKHNQTLL